MQKYLRQRWEDPSDPFRGESTDGLASEFYKEFMDQLSKPYLSMLNDLFGTGALLPLREANISLILKKSKPPENCGSHRPISLLNVDMKILSKILETRLEDILPFLIKVDQTGFIKGRNSCNNLRLLNVIHLCPWWTMDGLVVFLDTKKAFDCVEWSWTNLGEVPISSVGLESSRITLWK